MTDSPEPQRELARQLLAPGNADRATASASERLETAERAFERLNAHLQKVIGTTGYRMLLGRAVERARPEHPLLADLPAPADPRWPLGELAPGTRLEKHPDEVEEALVAVLTTFISLLGRFVGDGLAMRLVAESWPEPSGEDSPSPGRGVEPNG